MLHTLLLIFALFQPDFFTVRAIKAATDTVVHIQYPAQQNVWVCVIFRKLSEPAYTPRWCFEPERGARTESLRIPRWPPVPRTDHWEVMGVVQYDTQGKEFGYLESPWVRVD